MRRLPRLAVLVGLLVSTAAASVSGAPFAYVTNSGGSSVTIVDIATNAPSGPPIAIAGSPGGVLVNADASRVYVASYGAPAPSPNRVTVIEASSRTVLAQIALPSNFPTGLALSPNGARLFVTHNVPGGNTLTVIDTAANTVLSSIPAGAFNAGVVVHPNGSKLYVASWSAVLVYDAVSLAPLGSISGVTRPYGLAVNPAGTRLYIANYFGTSVSVVDTATDAMIGEVFTGSRPFAVSVSPDGTRLFVGNQTSKTLSIVDTGSLAILMDVPLGGATPYGVQSGPDGSKVYVADYFNNQLLVVDAASGVVSATAPTGWFPIAFGQFIRVAATAGTAIGPGGVAPSQVVLGSTAPVALSAVLTRQGGGAVAGANVEFLVDGGVVGSGVTGAGGVATLSMNPSALSAGSHAVSARYNGGTVGGVTYEGSSGGLGALRVVYGFVGFLPPLKEGTNSRGAGAMVLARWRLTNASGAPIGDLGTVASVSFGTMACGGAPSAWAAAEGTLTYDAVESVFTFRWKTERSMAGSCARLAVTLTDGTVHTADFSFR